MNFSIWSTNKKIKKEKESQVIVNTKHVLCTKIEFLIC